ncbi:hypothetical protein Acr_16g0008790 [Actinidia rufa]|uniref:CCHC-type domain-containing protein n=1 Tax=Actinidia rufa TaxID=165716 RepID=A0A7J0FZY3_9ERIC|nr:hypothetical protein Acr_16g0008790 [Actinidia rufa]
MTELGDMVQMLVRAVTALNNNCCSNIFSRHSHRRPGSSTPGEGKLNKGKHQNIRVTEDPVIPMESVVVVQQFLKLKLPTFKDYEGPSTNLAEYVPHLVATDEMRARRFEDGLRHEIRRAIRPLVLSTYADVLDKAIIVEQDEIEKKYFDSKRRQNFGIEVRNEIKCFHCNEVGHIRRNCPRLRTEVVTPRGGPVGENVRLAENARPGGNRLGNPENRGGNVNNQR